MRRRLTQQPSWRTPVEATTTLSAVTFSIARTLNTSPWAGQHRSGLLRKGLRRPRVRCTSCRRIRLSNSQLPHSTASSGSRTRHDARHLRPERGTISDAESCTDRFSQWAEQHTCMAPSQGNADGGGGLSCQSASWISPASSPSDGVTTSQKANTLA